MAEKRSNKVCVVPIPGREDDGGGVAMNTDTPEQEKAKDVDGEEVEHEGAAS